MKKKFLIGISAVAVLATLLMVPSAFACYGPALTPGFWKHNVGVYLGLENGAYSDPVYYPGYTPVVTKDTMGTWLYNLDILHGGTIDMTAAYNALNTKGGGAAGALIRNTAADIFNTAADLYTLL
jgi:hypothetical protein